MPPPTVNIAHQDIGLWPRLIVNSPAEFCSVTSNCWCHKLWSTRKPMGWGDETQHMGWGHKAKPTGCGQKTQPVSTGQRSTEVIIWPCLVIVLNLGSSSYNIYSGLTRNTTRLTELHHMGWRVPVRGSAEEVSCIGSMCSSELREELCLRHWWSRRNFVRLIYLRKLECWGLAGGERISMKCYIILT